MNVISEKIFFRNPDGYQLAARLDRPETGIMAYAVYAPCFTCIKEIHAALRISTSLAEKGIATLRLDFTGLGESEGEFASSSFSGYVQDLHAAINHLASLGKEPSILIGHSLGGTAALVATSQSPSIKAVVTINSPSHPRHVTHHFRNLEEQLESEGQAQIQIAGQSIVIFKHFFEDLQLHDMNNVMQDLGAALLVMHSPIDETVHIRNANNIFTTAVHPKSFICLDDMRHLVPERNDAEYIASLISSWVKRYV